MKKRMLSLLLALMMCLSLLPVAAFAADEGFVIESGVLVKYNGPGGNVTIPSGVTSIGEEAFLSCTGLTSVTIPNGVTSIGVQAFDNCTSLTSVTIPNSVTDIGDYAFWLCRRLTSVTIPSSVTSIGVGAFGDSGLTSVTIPSSVTSIGDSVFYGCESLTSVTIQSGVTSIAESAFYQCTGLTSVTIPDSVTSIEDIAFAYCQSLTSVTIPNSVTSIGMQAFDHCTSLTSVTIPDSVTSIGDNVFYGCTDLTGVYYGGSQEQWKAVSIGSNNGDLASATVHYDASPALFKFTDLKPNGFYVDAVDWAVSKGVTTGKTATTFAPDETCTHGHILTFLWRAAGSPPADVTLPFETTGNEYYLGAAKWAYEKGMIGANFNHKTPCTRADAVNYIWQAFGKETASYDGRFTDIPASFPYAAAVAWAAEKGVTTGATTTTFNPNGICNRGQIVTFLYRAYN